MSPPKFQCAVAIRIRDGENMSGDRHLIRRFAGGTLFSVVDGLGHGSAAAESATIAVQTLEQHAGESAPALIAHCHESLRATRGAAVSLATVRATDGQMDWLGVGNVEGVLVRAAPDDGKGHRPLLLLPGIVGSRLPQLLEADRIPLRRGDTLVLATDGIRSDFVEHLSTVGPIQRLADGILESYARETDDALVLVARYLEVDS